MATPTRPGVVWKRRILIPLWIIRICAMVFIIIAYALALSVLRNEGLTADLPSIGAVVVFMLFIVAVLLMDILAMLLFFRDALKPGTLLIMNCFQTGFWAGVLILDIVYIARTKDSPGAIIITVLIFLSFVALLIYAAIKYHRQRKEIKRGAYAPALNPAAPPATGFHPPAYMNAAPYQQNTSYSSQQYSAQPYAAAPGRSVELPELQGNGASTSYYNDQPVKPNHMV